MTDAVVSHEDDERVFQQAFLFQPLHHAAHVQIGHACGVKVERPVVEDDRITRVVGRQRDLFRIGGAAELGDHALFEGRSRLFIAFAQLAAVELHLHEEGLVAVLRPVMAVVHLRVPFEVVVRLAEWRASPLFFAIAQKPPGIVHAGQTAADAGVVARLLKLHRQRRDIGRQVNLQLTAPAAMMMRTNRRLIHPGDQRRAAGRAHRRGDIGPCELCPLRRQFVHRRRLNQGLAVAAEARRHVINDEPDDVRLRRPCGERNKKRGKQNEQ